MTPTIPDAAYHAALNAFAEADSHEDALMKALTAALPFMTGVKVKDEGKLLMDVTQAIFPEGWTMSNRNAVADGIRIVLSAIEPAPSPRAQALEDGFRKGLEAACGVVDAHSEYDRQLCCDGRECGCYGSTVHQSMQHYIRALSHPVSPAMGVKRPVEDGCKTLDDGRPCSMDEFMSALFNENVDEFDVSEAAASWVNGNWKEALSYLSDVPPHWRPLPQAPGVAV